MNLFSRRTTTYSLCGVLFGCLFPIAATVLESHAQLGTFSISSGLHVQSSNVLLWLINTTPFLAGLCAFLMGRQVDKLKEQENQLQHLREQLLVQEKMASLGQMTARIAHEIKNPLNFITNFAEGSVEMCDELLASTMQKSSVIPPDLQLELSKMIKDLRDNSGDIKQNGIRINEIVTTIMDHARGAKKEKTLTDIKDLVKQYLNLANQSFRATHPGFSGQIEMNFKTSENVAFVNPNSLGRVLLNMFNNALYALHQKQHNSGNTFTPILEIETDVQLDELNIIIRDNGGGIKPEIAKSIFDPFFTTKPTGHGNTGLGLSICKNIVENEHGGTIVLLNTPGKSTEFRISIPSSAPAIGRGSNESIPASSK